jgi:hypothetical protein
MYYGTEGKPFLTNLYMACLHVLLVRFIVVLNVEVAQVVRRLGVGNDADKVAQDALLQELLGQVLQRQNKTTQEQRSNIIDENHTKTNHKQNTTTTSQLTYQQAATNHETKELLLTQIQTACNARSKTPKCY